MNLIISAAFRDKGAEFVEALMALISNMGLECEEHVGSNKHFLCVNEPLQATEPEMSVALPSEPMDTLPTTAIGGGEMSIELPPIELSSPTFDADLNAQAAQAMSMGMNVAEPSIELAKEPEQVTQQDCGPHIIMSLTSATEVPTVIDTSVTASCLEVPTDVPTENGLMSFWFGGMEFMMPCAADALAVINPTHEIRSNTIRAVVRKVGSDESFAALVDVIRGDAERLVLGSDLG